MSNDEEELSEKQLDAEIAAIHTKLARLELVKFIRRCPGELKGTAPRPFNPHEDELGNQLEEN